MTPADQTTAIVPAYEYDYDSARDRASLRRELSEIWRYRDFVFLLALRNIKVRYQHSVLGVGWTVLSPLLTTAVLSIAFTTVFRQAAPDYPAYLLAGLLIWNFFIQTSSTIAAEMMSGVEVWRRIYAPKSVQALATLGTTLVHLLLALMPLVALMAWLGVPFGPGMLLAVVPIVCVALFALGVGLLLASCATRFRDINDLYQVGAGAWLYLTPVIYPRAIVPDRFQWLLILNPMTWYVETFRATMLHGSLPSSSTMFWLVFLSVTTVTAGYWVFTRATADLATRG